MDTNLIALESKRLILGQYSQEYAEDFLKEFTEEVCTYMIPRPYKNLAEAKGYISKALISNQKGLDIQLIILKKDTQEFLGMVGLFRIHTKTPEYGIWLKKSAHGHKYGREAATALKLWADKNLDYYYLRYPVIPENIASHKIPKSLGGKLVNKYLDKNKDGKTITLDEFRIYPDKIYGVDSDGHILNQLSSSKIQSKFQSALNEIQTEIENTFADKIHSLYLYGSVGRGKAKPKISDLDLILVFTEKPSTETLSKLKDLENSLSKKYISLFRDIGIANTYLAEISKDTYGWGCFLKCLSLHLSGENLIPTLVNFKPSNKIAKAFNGNLAQDIRNSAKKTKLSSKDIRSLSRKIVRTGFSLCQEEEKSWTTNLEKSFHVFCKYYPDKFHQMHQIFNQTQAPNLNSQEFKDILERFGMWVVERLRNCFYNS